MIPVLIALSYLLGLLLFLIVSLLLSARFTKGQRDNYPILKKLDGKQLRLFLGALIIAPLLYFVNALKDLKLYEQTLRELKASDTAPPNAPSDTTASFEQFEERLWRVKDDKHFSFDDWLFKAQAEYSRSDYQGAILSFTSALAKKPDEVRIYSQRGLAYYKLKDYQKSIADFNTVIESSPKNADAYMHRGNSYASMGRYADAIKDYTKVIELKPMPVHAYILRGNAFFKLKQFETAEEHYNEVMRLSPGAQVPYNNRGALFTRLKEYQSAEKDIKKAIEMDRYYLGAYNTLSQLKIVTGDYRDAISSEALSLLNRKRGRLEDRAMTTYLDCIVKHLLDQDTKGCESKLDTVSKVNFTFEWTYHYHDSWFDLYEDWLRKADISQDKRRFIAAITELLKQHRY